MSHMKEENAQTTSELLKEIRTVRQFGKEDEEAEKFEVLNEFMATSSEQVNVKQEILGVLAFFLFLSVRLYAIGVGGEFLTEGRMTLGQGVQISHCSMHI